MGCVIPQAEIKNLSIRKNKSDETLNHYSISINCLLQLQTENNLLIIIDSR